MKSFVTKIQAHYKRKPTLAGPGAGVTLEIECEIKWKKQGKKIVFSPANADVTFHSYYNTKSNTEYDEPGLKIKLDDITEPNDAEEFESRLYSPLNITSKNKLSDEDNNNRSLVLSPGWSRAKYKTGESFGFSVLLDPDYYIYAKGTATFLDAGVDAWNDLDSSDDDEDTID